MMDRLNSALKEVQEELQSTDDLEERKKLQVRYLRLFAAIQARQSKEELSLEELERWTEEVYEQNEIRPGD